MLHLAVEWLAGTYHGQEWPPSPLRLFQALLAGARRFPSAEHDFDGALRKLEKLPPPRIFAPQPTRASAVCAAVPNNDGDNVAAELADGDVKGARSKEKKLKSLRERAGRFTNGRVHYLWDCESSATWQALAERLTCLGQGIDLAWAQVTVGIPEGDRYQPDDEDGLLELQVPYPGALDALQKRHDEFRRAITGGIVCGVREPAHETRAYRSPASLPLRRSAAFLLRTLEGAPWSVGRDGALRVAAMVRHAVHEAAQTAGLEESAITRIMGHDHGRDGKINALPLPNAGHLWADGRVRRVLVARNATVPVNHWDAIVRRLPGAELRPVGRRQPEAILEPAPQEDKVVQAFRGPAETWSTVSPVILPGWDHRRGKPRPGRSARRLLKHAGIPEAAVANFSFEPAGQLAGTSRPIDYPVPQHLEQYPRTHLTIRFHERVCGPLYLGAGVGVGLGLLAPVRGVK